MAHQAWRTPTKQLKTLEPRPLFNNNFEPHKSRQSLDFQAAKL